MKVERSENSSSRNQLPKILAKVGTCAKQKEEEQEKASLWQQELKKRRKE